MIRSTLSYKFVLMKGIKKDFNKDVLTHILRFVNVDQAGLFEILWPNYYSHYRDGINECSICGLFYEYWLGVYNTLYGSAYINGHHHFPLCCSKICATRGDELFSMQQINNDTTE